MTGYHDFYDRESKPIADAEEWNRKIADPEYRRVASTVLPDGKWVSTLWVGLNYLPGRGPPLIFETMVFPSTDSSSGDDLACERYSTEKQALEGHKRLVDEWSKPQE